MTIPSVLTRRDAVNTLFLAALAGSTGKALPASPGNQTLVAYLSRSGNTRVIAGFLSREQDADLFEIRTREPYPEDYDRHVDLARRQRDAEIAPALEDLPASFAGYDVVFLGFPIWGGALPAPVRTFLSANDFSGKRLVPFVTHGGYGPGSALETVAELVPAATVLDPFVLECDQERAIIERVSSWLEVSGVKS
ncbi:flavodoxin [Roseibium aggregatum]|uniref:Flavodoxin n=1 Tax=Roseibium aggregatum TaxID=187304 RepID=A0A939J4C0_9HYPH|nr:flavodoxin [Roseibium aggregatum]MBN9670544.1 flavodoxin [Roseibium aggregatum]